MLLTSGGWGGKDRRLALDAKRQTTREREPNRIARGWAGVVVIEVGSGSFVLLTGKGVSNEDRFTKEFASAGSFGDLPGNQPRDGGRGMCTV